MASKILKTFTVTSAIVLVFVVAAFFLLPDPAELEPSSHKALSTIHSEQSIGEVANGVANVVEIDQTEMAQSQVETSVSRGPDQKIMQSLNQIQEILQNLDKRIVSIENELDIARLDNGEQQEYTDVDDDTDNEYSADSIAKQEKLKQYFSSLDQVFSADVDEQITTQKESYFDSMISSRAEWQNDASLRSVNCSLDRCKVIVRYNEQMDAMAKFELDGMVLLSQADLPKSVVRNINNGDGTTDMVVYFANKDSNIPPPN